MLLHASSPNISDYRRMPIQTCRNSHHKSHAQSLNSSIVDAVPTGHPLLHSRRKMKTIKKLNQESFARLDIQTYMVVTDNSRFNFRNGKRSEGHLIIAGTEPNTGHVNIKAHRDCFIRCRIRGCGHGVLPLGEARLPSSGKWQHFQLM